MDSRPGAGHPKETVPPELRPIIKDGLTTQMMSTLTGGVFLVAFALMLGASAPVIGLLAAIPPLAQLIQIPSIYLIERYRVRRKITVIAATISRVFLLLIAAIPFLFSPAIGLAVLITALALHASFGAVGGCSWNSWMHDLLPHDRLGSFFSKRMGLATAVGIPLSLAAASFVDHWRAHLPHNSIYGYSILFTLGFLSGLLGVYFISKIPEPSMAVEEEGRTVSTLIARPFKDVNFKNLITFLASWNFAVNLAAPFFAVYMLQRLQLDITFIIMLTVLSQVMNLLFLRIWGKFSDRYSNKTVLGVTGPLFIFSIFAWTFTTLPEKHALTIPLLVVIHLFLGISTAGVTLSSGNIGLKLAPKGQATAYLAATSFVTSLSAGIAPILGGLFANFFASRELSWTLAWKSPGGELLFQTLNLEHWDFLFFFAFLLGLYSLHRLSLVREIGEVEEKVILQELFSVVGRELKDISTAFGLRDITLFPFSILRSTFYRRKSPD